ncbi:MAG TPA: hypothetical protein VKR82_15675 [Candidatus Acidoferrales bacterium]|nr:hypothetical protein [Candidatus Acidoferrales bacterium]
MHGPSQPGEPRQKINRVEVYWTAVTYKTVAVYLVLGFAIIMAVVYLMNPAWVTSALDHFERVVNGDDSAKGPITPGQVRFVDLDGAVQVKHVSSTRWENATRGSTLDKGDLIQTGSDGLARLSFPDGTTYTVKADTLVTVEQNAVASDKSTNVGMHVSTGAVDLATPTWDSPKSKAEISFADARASMKENSRAAVHTDPTKNESDITIEAGSADVKQANQEIQVNKWEKASMNGGGGPIVKSNVLAPPDLVSPLNLQPLIEPDPKQASIRFEWKPVPDAVEYTLRVGLSSNFNKLAAEKLHVTAASAEVTGLDSGDYYWNVTAIGPSKKESEPSDAYKFTLVAQGKSQSMLLELDQPVLHGSVVEVIGRTEPSAALIINGQPVADISPDGHFRFFTGQLTKGSQTIVVTGQNRRGGTSTKSLQIVIP